MSPPTIVDNIHEPKIIPPSRTRRKPGGTTFETDSSFLDLLGGSGADFPRHFDLRVHSRPVDTTPCSLNATDTR